jgi:hypothetical protein
MAAGIRDYTVTMTKQSTTDTPKNMKVEIYDLNGGLKFAFLIPGADFTSFNTTVNGGAANATLSKTYTAASQQAFDYPFGYTGGY